jgi:hypothetical protein
MTAETEVRRSPFLFAPRARLGRIPYLNPLAPLKPLNPADPLKPLKLLTPLTNSLAVSQIYIESIADVR